jgi:SAM-dependent methyltransferase
METKLNQDYWNTRYLQQNTGWDLKQVSPPIKNYIDQLASKDLKILIPGCGNAWEAKYLAEQGFSNIALIDIAPALVNELQQQVKQYGSIQIICGDFFELNDSYDLILEQTFFCALHPSLRQAYTFKMHQLLKENGKLVGVLFNTQFEKKGPPFGGSIEEYEPLFAPYFQLKTITSCYNSYSKRQGTELFIQLIKK